MITAPPDAEIPDEEDVVKTGPENVSKLDKLVSTCFNP